MKPRVEECTRLYPRADAKVMASPLNSGIDVQDRTTAQPGGPFPQTVPVNATTLPDPDASVNTGERVSRLSGTSKASASDSFSSPQGNGRGKDEPFGSRLATFCDRQIALCAQAGPFVGSRSTNDGDPRGLWDCFELKLVVDPMEEYARVGVQAQSVLNVLEQLLVCRGQRAR
ncbi:hypothetical protein FRC17_010352 [Serendipita sp. 399]|nr:hypothetical protein FRC17_010352 [Serendipita sp. 399]